MRVLVVNDHLLFGQAIGAILEAQGIEVRMLTIGAGRVPPPRRSVARTCARSDEDRDAALLAEYLTPREREVLGLLTEGESSTSIARLLSLSPNTVRTHIQNVLTKLGVHSRFEAASLAVRHGILPERTRVVLVDEAGESAA